MTMGLALAERGLRMNAVSPGPVETPILGDFEQTMGKDNLEGVRDLIGRHATPADIAPAVLFLASGESSWINGVNLGADGGIGGAVVSGLIPAPEI
jgi:NAD(P)-dependent dehydrogenase (short-subunit alcohol dehydrogenase family)